MVRIAGSRMRLGAVTEWGRGEGGRAAVCPRILFLVFLVFLVLIHVLACESAVLPEAKNCRGARLPLS